VIAYARACRRELRSTLHRRCADAGGFDRVGIG
jgi:hypothetical protein